MGKCKFQMSWLDSYTWLREVKGDNSRGFCTLCNGKFKVDAHGHTDVTRHRDCKKHQICEKSAAGLTLPTFFTSKLRNLTTCIS